MNGKKAVAITALALGLAAGAWAQLGAPKLKGEIEISGSELEDMLMDQCDVIGGMLSCSSATKEIRCELKEDYFEQIKLECEIW